MQWSLNKYTGIKFMKKWRTWGKQIRYKKSQEYFFLIFISKQEGLM